MKKTLAALALALTAVFGLAACSAPAAEPTIAVTADTVVVDVRTSDEYNAGHLEGAVNIDVQAPDFDSLVSELPADGEYVVYCASGNRSSAAVARMEGLGFTNVTDAGGISEAGGSTGLETVTTP
ncbi:rhodanese-like domain-containing protein [Cryobacterium sp. Sr8]|uniref:Rhodanese-related sulfurtransferase n=1 Tax=Cryobacterium psychrotolerans TaxID=386301 RepID=A0A1G8XMX3_9MICO|nr:MULTISPECIES: rhodanese-like domain-containing protein [Cryobacterium]TFD44933.1 rhodanese-like domain-containing protein [Cryobacterium sp. TMT1-2-1]TFD80108.1 rhodanese-like domain-containing protein [Cryobacterium sp. Sr8]TFD82853.1 rhodanese-like domain-containing protein [Cryobacterium psychrotolerans]SDJ91898.1 Rhodanese-related sulfurtransferase [Cryobacterium psychrotolerans]